MELDLARACRQEGRGGPEKLAEQRQAGGLSGDARPVPPFPAPFVPEIGAGAEPDVPGRAERGEGGRARSTVAQWPG